MVVISKPLAGHRTSIPTSPAVYAPLSLSGVAIGFNIERTPSLDASDAGPHAQRRSCGRHELEPPSGGQAPHPVVPGDRSTVGDQDPGYAWAKEPIRSQMGLAIRTSCSFNPEFRMLFPCLRTSVSSAVSSCRPGNVGQLIQQVWELGAGPIPRPGRGSDGQPDPVGHEGEPGLRHDCFAELDGVRGSVIQCPTLVPEVRSVLLPGAGAWGEQRRGAPQLCGTDWMPYARSFAEAAARARACRSTGARIAPKSRLR